METDNVFYCCSSFTNTTLHLFELFLGFQIWFTVHALKYKIAIFNVEGIFLNGD